MPCSFSPYCTCRPLHTLISLAPSSYHGIFRRPEARAQCKFSAILTVYFVIWSIYFFDVHIVLISVNTALLNWAISNILHSLYMKQCPNCSPYVGPILSDFSCILDRSRRWKERRRLCSAIIINLLLASISLYKLEELSKITRICLIFDYALDL